MEEIGTVISLASPIYIFFISTLIKHENFETFEYVEFNITQNGNHVLFHDKTLVRLHGPYR